MLLFASLLLAGAADGFGRFSGDAPFVLPTIEAGPTWFRVIGDDSPKVMFAAPEVRAGIENRSKFHVGFRLRSGPGIPIRARYSLTGEGVELECVNGLALRGSGGAPFITWSEGSVGPGVPAPPSEWYLLSWAEERAPLFLAFPDKASALISAESQGEFFVATEEAIAGRVFVRLPLGTKKVATTRASDLGQLFRSIEPAIPMLTRAVPRVLGESIEMTRDGVSAKWKFDQPGAIVPQVIAAGKAPGMRVVGKWTPLREGVSLLDGTDLQVSFSVRQLSPGAAILNGGSGGLPVPPAVMSGQPESIMNAAIAWLCGVTDASFMRAANRILETAPAENVNGELAAALAFFAQSMAVPGEQAIGADVDWMSWRVQGLNPSENSILCCLLSMSEDPNMRMAAAMIAASLFGERVPLMALRAQLFPDHGTSPASWFTSMTSPVRLLSTNGVSAWGEGNTIVVEGPARAASGASAVLYSRETLRVVSSSNLREALISNHGPVWTVVGTATTAGVWRVRIARPAGSKPLPTAAPGPSYSAVQH